MSRIPPFPRTTPGRSVTPARCIHLGCRTGPGLGHPRPASVLKSPWPHFRAFLGRAQPLARSPSSRWPRICAAPAVSNAAARGRYCTRSAAHSFLQGSGWAPTSTTGVRPGAPQHPGPTAYYRYQLYWLLRVQSQHKDSKLSGERTFCFHSQQAVVNTCRRGYQCI